MRMCVYMWGGFRIDGCLRYTAGYTKQPTKCRQRCAIWDVTVLRQHHNEGCGVDANVLPETKVRQRSSAEAIVGGVLASGLGSCFRPLWSRLRGRSSAGGQAGEIASEGAEVKL